MSRSSRLISSIPLLLAATVAANMTQASEFWVSPDGDDFAPGTFAEPFRTL
jgi:hypothetical protein